MRPVLDYLSDGTERPLQEVIQVMAARLSPEEAAQTLKSGKQTVIANRTSWAVTYLVHAGLLERPERGRMKITSSGQQALDSYADIDVSVLDEIPEFREWKHGRSGDESLETDDDGVTSWLVGAMIGGVDLTDEFLGNGSWRINAPSESDRSLVAAMKKGDRIAIKSTYTRKQGLPFETDGETVSVLMVKARGVVAGPARGDEVPVDWDGGRIDREWYGYTRRTSIWRLNPQDPSALALERFVFADEPQDYEAFALARSGTATTQTTLASMEAPAGYDVDSIVDDGAFLPLSKLQEIIDALDRKRNVILQGAPGTGKTWLARRLGWVLAGERGSAATQVVQFHQNTAYEDFVRGYRPTSDGSGAALELVDGPFLRLAATAKESGTKHTMVIEEINRGNPARSLGEMLTLMEATKREPSEAIHLQYERSEEKTGYWLPDNLYVIGTMNTADRSIAQLDAALRRRFAFITIEPQFNDAWRAHVLQVLPEAVVSVVAKRITELNARIADDRDLGPGCVIGHSYFTPSLGQPIDDSEAWYTEEVKTSVAPLLHEYWIDHEDTYEAAVGELLKPMNL